MQICGFLRLYNDGCANRECTASAHHPPIIVIDRIYRIAFTRGANGENAVFIRGQQRDDRRGRTREKIK